MVILLAVPRFGAPGGRLRPAMDLPRRRARRKSPQAGVGPVRGLRRSPQATRPEEGAAEAEARADRNARELLAPKTRRVLVCDAVLLHLEKKAPAGHTRPRLLRRRPPSPAPPPAPVAALRLHLCLSRRNCPSASRRAGTGGSRTCTCAEPRRLPRRPLRRAGPRVAREAPTPAAEAPDRPTRPRPAAEAPAPADAPAPRNAGAGRGTVAKAARRRSRAAREPMPKAPTGRRRGTVKVVKPGYCFVVPDAGGPDVFCATRLNDTIAAGDRSSTTSCRTRAAARRRAT